MPSIILRIPESLLAELDHVADETYTNRSALIRQSIVRNLAIIRQVEFPAILTYHRNLLPKLLTEGNK
ncbi:MAG: ribbon-helix-helix protein, CopG family [Nitrospira sp.]|nr:ribbon-helix-helix protein, CopG family [Nitrospira sp.]